MGTEAKIEAQPTKVFILKSVEQEIQITGREVY